MHYVDLKTLVVRIRVYDLIYISIIYMRKTIFRV